ncbi:hypothetical protein D8B26_005448 [Coccidioides posadasii str. Silveira]|uniref:Interferon-related developmental regulator N-terminal domain-containing protein n=3 Tax=Coccidioides posadasii TaxID=199306 RepID=E9DJ23_COCPS|nr:Interferon-related developmental regulator family protein [Coccidioides posadasii C735 delta SOWgp]EER24326.1 Interferon-related developmental regulator family protein [Coccidioides posadasii C735 delta SOWgp]EFW13608.1 conserved hypothetical protein [Coccidioides posadasii str. Silveira]KMM66005.1 hypothetical protein CPAG_02346 [Coccidioides posadasii RMSCC 3488]QVM10795.1 hypothetical protein D8B26_005448 [Coccidioides posadasii str. Silveira]|eukprot:XP_003066471.1 Interferon-related developmental regulator family protein [Coccidioides posadasii C735 delta SOWgp]
MLDHRRAHESKKTVSRKSAKRDADRLTSLIYSSPSAISASRQNSRDVSRNASRDGSRNVSRDISRVQSRVQSRVVSRDASISPSRDQSDDEYETSSESGTCPSTASWDERGYEDFEAGIKQDRPLATVVNDLIDRKHNSLQAREENLAAYGRILARHYAADEMEHNVGTLLTAFLQSIKQESTEKETILALKAIALTAVTTLSGAVYDKTGSVVRRKIAGSSSLAIKSAAIRCLGASAFFGGASEDELLDEMEFLMEIIMSDGHFIETPDDPEIVTAALQEWGLLATGVDDLEHLSEDAMETFADQLDSTEPEVQTAAGQNIALLYEKSFSPQEEDEEIDESEYDLQISHDDISQDDYRDDNGALLVQRYKPYHNTPAIEGKIQDLAKISGRHISKKSKRTLHMHFDAILTTIENPRHGPRFRQSIDHEKSESYGTRAGLKFHRFAPLNLNRWWKWCRMAALQRLLAGGIVEHYRAKSRAIVEYLPGLSMDAPEKGRRRRGKDRRKVGESSGRGGEMGMLYDTLHG